MKVIELTKNKFAIVDDSDFLLLNKFKWCTHSALFNRTQEVVVC